MEMLHIIYIGANSSIKNVVDEITFEKIYKPKGWQIDKQYHKEFDENITHLKDENKILNYQKMKNTKPQQFDDGLIVKKE